jgi:EAL domain-containing protein (putative c-di-GMP-specific phosphodiesterase class I)
MVRRADLTAALYETVDPVRLMQRVTDRTLELIAPADGVMIGLADAHGVTYVCGAGHRVSHLGTRVDLDTSLSGLAVRTGAMQRSDDTESDPRVDGQACRRLSVASLVCIPLTRRTETLGVLAVNARHPHAFTDDDVAILSRLADFLSVAVGSAYDLSGASTQLLELGEPSDRASTERSADTASRYVVSVLNPDSLSRVDSTRDIEAVLDDASLLSMLFQPIIDLVTGRVAAVEALARFDVSPYRAPDLWFSQAHQAGLGVELELLAVSRALAHLPMLPADDVAVAINAGPETVASTEFLDTFVDMPARRVIIELTEHQAVDDYARLTAALRTLRRKGVRIAIDDAGSGYAGLTHILKLAPDFIKLDRELVNGIDLDPVRRALAMSLTTFATETGAQLIAEGVENEDELDALRRLGVRYAQGYHLAYPAPLSDTNPHHRSPQSARQNA